MTVLNLSWIILDENKSNSDEEKYERNQGIESEYNNYKRIDQCVNSLYSLRTRTELIKNINIGIAIPPDWTLQLYWSKGWRCEERFWTLLTSCVLPGRGCKALQVSCELDQWGKRRDHLTINYKHPGCQPADRGEKQAWVDIFLPWTWSFVQPSVLKNLICYDVLLRPAWNHFSTRCTLSFKAAGTKKIARKPWTWSINWVNIKQSNILLTILHVDCGGHIDDINFHVIHLAFYPGSDLARLSMVPPHLVDGRGNSFRSALIPFCAFDGNMTTLGQPIDGLDFPACNQTWYCGTLLHPWCQRNATRG